MKGDVSDWIERARAVRIEDEAHCRGIRLRQASKIESVGPCPICGGRDRFGINTRKQAFHCRGCDRGGGVVQLVQLLDSCDFDTACRTLTREDRPAPPVKLTEPATAAPDQETLARCAGVWRKAIPPEGTLVEPYLRNRGLLEALPDISGRVLRFHPACPFGTDLLPCMLALFRSISGDEPVGIHRTALTPAGQRIDRKAWGSIEAAAIKLSSDAEIAAGLTIGEGIETTLAGMAIGFAPAWALGSSGKIGRFPVLPGVECLTILVDHDDIAKSKRGAGQIQARECSARWTAAGREVLRVIPDRIGSERRRSAD
jgi:hypothetical protein